MRGLPAGRPAPPPDVVRAVHPRGVDVGERVHAAVRRLRRLAEAPPPAARAAEPQAARVRAGADRRRRPGLADAALRRARLRRRSWPPTSASSPCATPSTSPRRAGLPGRGHALRAARDPLVPARCAGRRLRGARSRAVHTAERLPADARGGRAGDARLRPRPGRSRAPRGDGRGRGVRRRGRAPALLLRQPRARPARRALHRRRGRGGRDLPPHQHPLRHRRTRQRRRDLVTGDRRRRRHGPRRRGARARHLQPERRRLATVTRRRRRRARVAISASRACAVSRLARDQRRDVPGGRVGHGGEADQQRRASRSRRAARRRRAPRRCSRQAATSASSSAPGTWTATCSPAAAPLTRGVRATRARAPRAARRGGAGRCGRSGGCGGRRRRAR